MTPFFLWLYCVYLGSYFGVLMAYGGQLDVRISHPVILFTGEYVVLLPVYLGKYRTFFLLLLQFLREQEPRYTETLVRTRLLPLYTFSVCQPYLVATANWVLGELASCLTEVILFLILTVSVWVMPFIKHQRCFGICMLFSVFVLFHLLFLFCLPGIKTYFLNTEFTFLIQSVVTLAFIFRKWVQMCILHCSKHWPCQIIGKLLVTRYGYQLLGQLLNFLRLVPLIIPFIELWFLIQCHQCYYPLSCSLTSEWLPTTWVASSSSSCDR